MRTKEYGLLYLSVKTHMVRESASAPTPPLLIHHGACFLQIIACSLGLDYLWLQHRQMILWCHYPMYSVSWKPTAPPEMTKGLRAACQALFNEGGKVVEKEAIQLTDCAPVRFHTSWVRSTFPARYPFWDTKPSYSSTFSDPLLREAGLSLLSPEEGPDNWSSGSLHKGYLKDLLLHEPDRPLR